MVTKKTTKNQPAVKKTTVKKKAVVKKPVAKKATVKKTVLKKTVAKKKVAKKKVATKKPAVKKVAPKKKTAVKKTAVKKAAPKKPVVKKAVAKKKAPAKKSAPRKKPAATSGPMGVKPYAVKRGEDYMNLTQRNHFEHILQLWKTELMQEVDTTVDHLKTEDITSVADPIDRASLETDFSLELRTRDRERKLIRKIEKAMDLLDHGEYGYCEDCGAEIGVRRLEARPTAMKCIDCKTFQEIKEKQGL